MGESAICEHWGVYRSSELSRFRNGCRKFKLCPMCGHKNGITNEYFCEKTLLVVEYLDNLHNELDETNRIFLGPNAGRTGYFNTSNDNPEPAPGGHGYYGAGGHYVGPCLCSPIGCDPYNLLDPNVCQVSRRINKTPESPVDFSARPKGHPNPFYSTDGFHRFTNPSMAIVAEEHIRGYTAGRRWYAGQEVFVTSAPPSLNGMRSSPDDTFQEPLLWRCGRLGGRAVVRFWNTCGGHNNRTGWHGNKVLCSLPWQVERQEASVLLLQEDGSTGLDLSFATHLFLLERVKDPALLNQIISRAHRMGAKGPVHVQLIQVRADEEEL